MLTAEPLSASDGSELALPAHVLAELQAVTARQNERDAAHDAQDLRQLLRAAIQANSDVEMIKVLQVGRDEMPEAIKTLQRALEAEVEREKEDDEAAAAEPTIEVATMQATYVEHGGLTRSATVLSTDSQASSHTSSRGGSSGRRSSGGRTARDTLDREFIETGIDALRRLSGGGAEVALPSWTITRYEVEREEKIGMGFFSDVYRGTWRDGVVAIKVLAPTTPKELFVHEVSACLCVLCGTSVHPPRLHRAVLLTSGDGHRTSDTGSPGVRVWARRAAPAHLRCAGQMGRAHVHFPDFPYITSRSGSAGCGDRIVQRIPRRFFWLQSIFIFVVPLNPFHIRSSRVCGHVLIICLPSPLPHSTLGYLLPIHRCIHNLEPSKSPDCRFPIRDWPGVHLVDARYRFGRHSSIRTSWSFSARPPLRATLLGSSSARTTRTGRL